MQLLIVFVKIRGMRDAVATMPTVVFVHAHPDDEAIFTGGTIALLADRGVRVVLVMATSGEAGRHHGGPGPLDGVRRRETRRAAAVLGAGRTVFLGYADSGLGDDPAPGSFAAAPVEEVSEILAAVLVGERAGAVVGYDERGIYAHPDHLRVHEVTRRAAELAGIATRYDATVDREHLHFVGTHLVHDAAAAVSSSVGSATVEVTTTVDVRTVLARKWTAVRTHASQIDGTRLAGAPEAFAAVYGTEWFVRTGPPSVLDDLPTPHLGARHPDGGPGWRR
jgi:LmbE family N-acetylglucosaminyl deacetylase